MAHPYCSGPAHIYVGVAAGKKPLYLGTAEGTPAIEERPEYEPVMNDVTGSRKPLDFSFQGLDAIVSATLTRWNNSVMRLLRNIPRSGVGANVPGTLVYGDIGTFMLYEGAAYPLWITFPYSAKAAMSDLEPGYHFLAAFLESPIATQAGTRPKKMNLVWYCASVYVPGVQKLVCYDEAMQGLPAVD